MKHLKITVHERARLKEILRGMQCHPKIMPLINLGRERNGCYWDTAGTVWYRFTGEGWQVDIYRCGEIFTFLAEPREHADQAIAACGLSKSHSENRFNIDW